VIEEALVALCQAHNKQLQRTVQTVSRRGPRASFHYACAPRFKGQCAAAELRRYAASEAYLSVQVRRVLRTTAPPRA
jgi:hypothetical protein